MHKPYIGDDRRRSTARCGSITHPASAIFLFCFFLRCATYGLATQSATWHALQVAFGVNFKALEIFFFIHNAVVLEKSKFSESHSIIHSLLFFIWSTFKPRCERNVSAMGCLDLVQSKHVGCACRISALLATLWKIDSTAHRVFRSATVCETITSTRSRGTIVVTRTSRQTQTTCGKQTRCTEMAKITKSKIGMTEEGSSCP